MITLFVLPVISIEAQTAKTYPTLVEAVLQKAGANRVELEQFLDKYRTDEPKSSGNSNTKNETNLKYKAACFLVSNMDIHYSETFYWADSLNQKVEFNEQSYPNYSESKKAFKELTAKRKLHAIIGKEYDIHKIKGAFLIQNLESAFSAWQSSKSNYLTFDEFCEYLLPYRSLTEKLEVWRPQFADTFKIKDQGNRWNSITEPANDLSKTVGAYFINSFSFEEKNNPTSFLSPSQLLFRKQGHCEDQVNLTNLVFRSQGLPCSVNMIPYHATSTGRHYWNSTIDRNHDIVAFEGSRTTEEFKLGREPSKVVKFTYSKQKDVPGNWVEESEIPDNYLRRTNFIDVTDQYWRTKDLRCTLSITQQKKLAYIAVFNGLQWCPAYWGKITEKSDVVFPKMSCGVAYLPMLYVNGKLVPAAYPTLLYDTKEEKVLKPDKENRHTITLNEQENYLKYRTGKRYRLYYWDNKWELITEKTATLEPRLTFENVPSNALLLMVPEYSARKERPFVVNENGERVWW